jgi:hypothetical protein
MKLEITVYKEVPKTRKGFGGRELLAEGLQYVGRLSGPAEREISGKTVPELMSRIKQAVGTIGRKDRELQFRFAPEDLPANSPSSARIKLEGDEISEVFRGMEKLIDSE